MPADGDALLALVLVCTAAEGAAAANDLGEASKKYFSRVAALRKISKTGEAGFAAIDAKKEGGLLVKIVNSSMKQQVRGGGLCSPIALSTRG